MAELRLEDISIDEDGRVIIANPEIAEQVRAAAERKPKPVPNQSCNTVRGCGEGANNKCNVAAGCGT